MPPWEKYQSTGDSGAEPWKKYQTSQPKAVAPEKPESTLSDVGKSLVGGVERGITAAPMVVGDLINGMAAGPQLLGQGIKDTIEGNPTTKNPKIWQPFMGSEEVLQLLPKQLQPHEPSTFLGGVANFAGQMAGGAGVNKVTAPKEPAIQIPASKLKEASQAAYKAADTQGGALHNNVSDNFFDTAPNVATKDAKIAQMESSRPYAKALEEFKIFKGEPLTLERAQYIDERLGDMANGFFTQGGLAKEGKKILDVQDKFRDMLANAKDTDMIGGKAGFDSWKSGQKLWSESMKMRDIEKIVERASYSDNPATVLKNGFGRLAQNDKRLRGFTPAERKMIVNASKTGNAVELMRSFGSRLIPIGHLAAGNVPGALASHMTSIAGRNQASKMQLSKAKKITESIANRAMPPTGTRQPIVNPAAKPAFAIPLGSAVEEMLKP